MAALLLGVTTVTFATGMAASVTKYGNATSLPGLQVQVEPGDPAFDHQVASKLSDSEAGALLRSLPGTLHVTADEHVQLPLPGYPQGIGVDFLRGDSSTLGFQQEIVEGHWLDGPGEVVAASKYLLRSGTRVGDRITLRAGDRQTRVTIVGEILSGAPDYLFSDWQTLTPLAPDYAGQQHLLTYLVQLRPGTGDNAYAAEVQAASPGLYSESDNGTDPFVVTVISLSTTLTVMLGSVAALGVFNTVVLNARERRRDLGMLKSIGMTPRQVTAMMVTSMAALGVVGGLIGVPLGIVAHRLIVPLTGAAAKVDIPGFLLNVWSAPMLALLALAGVAIAALGALVPSLAAARLTIAEVLQNE